jgi:hypothetical protein
MKAYISLTLLFGVSSISAFSVLTGGDAPNATDFENIEPRKTDVFRQLLNQETLIRMSMAKDMLVLKQSLLSAEGDISSLKQTTVEMKKELQHIKRENERLSNENAKFKKNSGGYFG